jgi:hypothetical protein
MYRIWVVVVDDELANAVVRLVVSPSARPEFGFQPQLKVDALDRVLTGGCTGCA